ncbi:MAG: rhodanese-like domain-containing protein [Bacteroidetes bacterium]|nr:rhodanese-like domain-containing protein [Bacteroidota bacterium]
MKKQLFIEVSLLLGLSTIVGFLYTYIAQQGFFAPKKAPTFTVLNLSDAKKYFEEKSALFLDARSEYEYKLGHIPGALNVPLYELKQSSSISSSIPHNIFLIVYCDGSECHSSFQVAEYLLTRGYTNVGVFYGGWQEWTNAGLPIE